MAPGEEEGYTGLSRWHILHEDVSWTSHYGCTRLWMAWLGPETHGEPVSQSAAWGLDSQRLTGPRAGNLCSLWALFPQL